MIDMVHHPAHYTNHPSGIEVWDIAKYLPYALGCAFKYIARWKHKGKPEEDLRKAVQYLNKTSEEALWADPSSPLIAKFVRQLREYTLGETDSRQLGILELFKVVVVTSDTAIAKVLVRTLEAMADEA